MSYILDALRRADAERERGAVPGLHDQPRVADREPSARNFTPLVWAASGAGALMVAVVALLMFAPWRDGAPGPQPPLAPSPQLNPALAARDTAPATMAAGESPAARAGGLKPAARPVEAPIAHPSALAAADDRSTPADASATARTDTASRLSERATAGRVAVLAPRGAATSGMPARKAPADAAPAAVAPYTAATDAAAAGLAAHDGAAPSPTALAAPSPATPAPASRTTPIPDFNNLPAATRAQLPRLNVGGAIYSDAPSGRMLILNGQIYHEGDKPAADTVLEQIRLKSAVLNFRGQRYEIAF